MISIFGSGIFFTKLAVSYETGNMNKPNVAVYVENNPRCTLFSEMKFINLEKK